MQTDYGVLRVDTGRRRTKCMAETLLKGWHGLVLTDCVEFRDIRFPVTTIKLLNIKRGYSFGVDCVDIDTVARWV